MAQQIINNGTVAGDGTGEILFTSFDKVNDNFTELYADKLDNVVYINSADDFPDAVGGVRELVPFSGASVTYIIAPKEIDMGSDRFTVTDGNIVIRGEHRTASQITTSSSGTMFTVIDSNFFQEFIGFTCSNGQWVDFSVPSLGVFSFANQNAIIYDCNAIGEVEGALTTSLRTFTVVSCFFGLEFFGTHSQLNISQMFALNWSDVLIELGTSSFEIINISSGSRFISPLGTTTLSGLANNGNLTAGGRGIVEGNLFNGLGTAISGIDTADNQWNFQGNVFSDNSTPNTFFAADAFLTSSRTVPISASSTYYPIDGGDWDFSIASRFTVGTDGLVTYTGLETIGVATISNATVEKVGGGSDLICLKTAVNGVVQDKTVGCTDNSTPTQISSTGFFQLSTGDTLQLYVANDGSTSDVIVSNATFLVRDLV